MINTVLFDMDGVLVDLCEVHRVALNEALKRNGSQPISNKEHYDTFNGLPTKTKLETLVNLGRIKTEDIDFISEEKQKLTIDNIMREVNPNIYAILTLQSLKESGMKMAVCSNSVRATIDAALEASLLTKYFDLILSNQDVTKPKPDPEIYLKAMEILGSKPEETLIVEDNFNGIAAAMASGAHVLRIPMGCPQIILALHEVHVR